MKRLMIFVFACTMTLLLCLYADQAPRAQDSQTSMVTESAVQKISITGKIVKEPDGYYIQGQSPSNVFRILNPIPKRLDRFAKRSILVQIEAGSVLGDNVDILKLNGKVYR